MGLIDSGHVVVLIVFVVFVPFFVQSRTEMKAENKRQRCDKRVFDCRKLTRGVVQLRSD
jgi:hypothetical protein